MNVLAYFVPCRLVRNDNNTSYTSCNSAKPAKHVIFKLQSNWPLGKISKRPMVMVLRSFPEEWGRRGTLRFSMVVAT